MKMYKVSYLGMKDEWFGTANEAYINMLQFIQDNYKEDVTVAVRMIRELNESFNNFNGAWFGVDGFTNCFPREVEEARVVEKVAAPARGITKDMFIKWVKEIKKIKDDYDMFLDQVYEIFGSSAQDAICNAMNEGYMIKMLEDFVGDKNKTLSYYFYELGCDFSEFDNNVELDGAPSVKDYGDLYDFIMYENGVTNVSDDDDSSWEDYD